MPEKMRAMMLDQPAPVETRPLRAVELDVPALGEDDVLVQASVCAICRTDLHIVEGELPLRRTPIVPGHQIVGRVERAAAPLTPGARVGIAWLHRTCGQCRFCLSGRENLCDAAEFTGWTVNGGYAERVVAPASFVYPLPEGFTDLEAAPLLCAGIIGYRALRATELDRRGGWHGARLGIYGFGAAGHICLQIARARGAEVYVMTRDRERHQRLAAELGATWTGGVTDAPPVKLDAAIIFAPAGELIPVALRALDKGGTLVLGGIHMSPTPPLEYSLLYGERRIVSVANNTRDDGREFLAEAATVPVRTHVQTFPFERANEALLALKNDAIRGAGVLVVQ